MGDFKKADSSVYLTFLELIEKTFPEISGYSFGLLFREKIKKSRGNVVVAEICLPGKLLSYFAKNDDGNPFDFLMIVDEMAWACARDEDRIRVIRHELRHVNISEKGVPRLVDHDFQDFHEEVELNADDPSWCAKLVEITLAGYKQVKDGQADPRVDRRDADDIAPVTKSPQRQPHLPLNVDKKQIDTVDDMKGAIDAGVKKGLSAIKSRKDAKEEVNRIINNSAKAAGQFDGKDKPAGDVGFNLDELARKKGLLPEEASA